MLSFLIYQEAFPFWGRIYEGRNLFIKSNIIFVNAYFKSLEFGSLIRHMPKVSHHPRKLSFLPTKGRVGAEGTYVDLRSNLQSTVWEASREVPAQTESSPHSRSLALYRIKVAANTKEGDLWTFVNEQLHRPTSHVQIAGGGTADQSPAACPRGSRASRPVPASCGCHQPSGTTELE